MKAKKNNPKATPADLPKQAEPYVLTDSERAELERYRAQRDSLEPLAKISLKSEGNNIQLTAEFIAKHGKTIEANDIGYGRLARAFNCRIELADDLTMKLTKAQAHRHLNDAKAIERALNSDLATVASLEPRDAHEAVLVSQMVMLNNAILDAHEKLSRSNSLDAIRVFGNLLNQLQRSYTTQAEALAKYRNRGKQEVRVYHQHVNVAANQAVVGINTPAGGAGVGSELEAQPHGTEYAAVEYSPGQAMPSALEKVGQSMQVASG